MKDKIFYPAFPVEKDEIQDCGMSKRFYAACAAMQGILATQYTMSVGIQTIYAKDAFMMADELLKQEINEPI